MRPGVRFTKNIPLNICCETHPWHYVFCTRMDYSGIQGNLVMRFSRHEHLHLEDMLRLALYVMQINFDERS